LDSELTSFADDLVLQCWAPSVELLEIRVNASIAMVADWGRKVKLSFNASKTQVMVYTKKRDFPEANFTMNGVHLEIVDHIRYLGVIVDKDLRWRHHLIHVQKKSSKLIGQITSVARNMW